MADSISQNEAKEAVALEVRQLLARLKLNLPAHNALVQEAELARVVSEQIRQGWSGSTGDLAYRTVCRRIYEVCHSGDEDLQEIAYQWLGAYLYYGIARKPGSNREQAEDLTNSALEIIVRKLDSCRQPEFFLSWAAQIASREVLQHFRRRQPELEAEKILQEVRQQLAFKPEEVQVTAPARAEPETLILSRERLGEIVSRIEQFKSTKRAKLYKKILYGTYFLGLDDLELATRLEISAKEVQKMRSHALNLLRKDRDWLDKIR